MNFVNLVGPAVDAYKQKAAALHDEFSNFILKHAGDELGCDTMCVKDCANSDNLSFFEMPDCLKFCKC